LLNNQFVAVLLHSSYCGHIVFSAVYLVRCLHAFGQCSFWNRILQDVVVSNNYERSVFDEDVNKAVVSPLLTDDVDHHKISIRCHSGSTTLCLSFICTFPVYLLRISVM